MNSLLKTLLLVYQNMKIFIPCDYYSTLIWVGYLGVRFEVGGGGELPRLKLVKIMLETSNLARKYKLICSFRKYTF